MLSLGNFDVGNPERDLSTRSFVSEIVQWILIRSKGIKPRKSVQKNEKGGGTELHPCLSDGNHLNRGVIEHLCLGHFLFLKMRRQSFQDTTSSFSSSTRSVHHKNPKS